MGNTLLHNLVITASQNPDNCDCLLEHLKKLSIRKDFIDAVDIQNHDNKTVFYLAVELANENNDDNF